MKVNNEWILKDGHKRNIFSTFPYAFRQLYNMVETADKSTESIRTSSEIIETVYLLSPAGKLYSYDDAMKLAKSQGLITLDGQLNSKEFKRK